MAGVQLPFIEQAFFSSISICTALAQWIFRIKNDREIYVIKKGAKVLFFGVIS